MSYAILFFLLSLAGALGLPLLCGISLWWALLFFPLLEALCHFLFLFIPWLACLRGRDRQTPLERQVPQGWKTSRRVGRIMCAYGGVRLTIKGEELLPEGRFLLVSDHRSIFDPLLVMGYLDRYDISFVSKPSNMRLPMIGDIACAAGFLAIDRENDREALKTILRAADYLKRGICSMGIYPEGHRSRSGHMEPFHAGSFKIAQRAGVPLAIAATHGTEKIRQGLFLRPHPVLLEILEVLPADRVKAMPTRELSDYAFHRIARALGEEPEAAGTETEGETDRHASAAALARDDSICDAARSAGRGGAGKAAAGARDAERGGAYPPAPVCARGHPPLGKGGSDAGAVTGAQGAAGAAAAAEKEGL